jgi:AcrR family transcriptional regulator
MATPKSRSAGRARKARFTRNELYRLVWSKPLTLVAEEFGISGNGLAKICDRLLIPYPHRGYWAKVTAGKKPPRDPLPPAPDNSEATITISPHRAASRRKLTRLPPETRREQLADAAGTLIETEGLHAATMKRIARDVGISEAQAYNHFKQRQDLLVHLARREIAAMDAARFGQIGGMDDHLTRVTLSTVIYLREVAKRGAFLQTLLNSPEVRLALRKERRPERRVRFDNVAARMGRNHAVPEDFAKNSTVVLTSVVSRAGRMLARKKLSLALAEKLAVAIVLRANRDLIDDSRPARDV